MENRKISNLLFLGDSITDCNHFFDTENLGYGYVRMISEQINASEKNYQVQNMGNDGFTVSAVRRLWKRKCLHVQPDLITILIGINDLAVIKNTGITPSVGFAQFCETYQNLLDEIRITADCPILLMEPFVFPRPAEYLLWEEELTIMNQMIKELAQSNGAEFLPLWESLRGAEKDLGLSQITTDGIHLTAAGHQIIAERWMNFYLGKKS